MSRRASLSDYLARGGWLLVLLIALCTGLEALLQLADPATGWRATALEMGGFWPGLWRDWPPAYAAQPYVMFLSYGFLHAGLLHLAVNMVTLWSLGRAVLDRAGAAGFALIYGGAMIGGGLGYAVLAAGPTPMVGASGALFGLAGGLLAWAWRDRTLQAVTRWPVAQAVALLVALNLVLWWAMDGQLAWQTHAGGFVAGWLLARYADPGPQAPA